MKDLCVVHLVRAQNGIEPFERFLESYRKYPSGVDHDLMIVFKGFKCPEDANKYRELLAPLRYKDFFISDKGFDITAYFSVLHQYVDAYRYFCFLNSYSVIMAPDWLLKLYEHIRLPHVGLVGATGSWTSHHTNAFAFLRRLRREISSIFRFKSRDNNVEMTGGASYKVSNVWKTMVRLIEILWLHLIYIIYFSPFPNFHVRTNAFMISGKLMTQIKCPTLKVKFDAYLFESGRRGLTSSVFKMGKRALVVGKNGVGYEKELWNESGTFWQSEQENLLVSDNQTYDYQYGSSERRRFLSCMAWRGGSDL